MRLLASTGASGRSSSDGQGLSAAKAIVVGHLLVTGPVLAIIGVVGLGGYAWFALTGLLIGGLVGCGVAWLWWSRTVPKWTRWALSRGASPDRVQRLAAATGLTWPRGWIFGRTEFGPKDRHE